MTLAMASPWHSQARLLQEEGLTPTQIAKRFGVTRSAVWKALNPEAAKRWNRKQNARRHQVKLDWDRERRRRLREARAAAPPPLWSPDPGKIRIYNRARDVIDHVLVDHEDWERFKHMRFHFAVAAYAATRIDGKAVYLHRMILGLERGSELECDHVNRDTRDNRRANLRAVTHAENCANRGGIFAKRESVR